jgi:hypothetical protein
MSNQELVQAYSEGRISRRTMVRRLVAGGVSLSAAISYAHLLAPNSATAGSTQGCSDNYPTIAMRVLSKDLQNVVADRKLKIRARPSEGPMDLTFTVTTRVDGADVELGSRSLTIFDADARKVGIPLANVAPLRGRGRARVKVTAFRQPRVGQFPLCNQAEGTMSVTGVLR